MKIEKLPDITDECVVCNTESELHIHAFHIGSPEKPVLRREYLAALYHNRQLNLNFCDAGCVVKYLKNNP